MKNERAVRGTGKTPRPAEELRRDLLRHVVASLGSDPEHLDPARVCRALALTVRERLARNWIETQRSYYERRGKRVYYLSLEYLPGRMLLNGLHSLGLVDAAREAVAALGQDLEAVAEREWDPGLGNGGLGRLASCFLDSLATLDVPAYGYGIRYDYGIFYQTIEKGEQVERCDNWLRAGNVWEFERPENLYQVRFGGRVRESLDNAGRLRCEWVDADTVMAMACDMLIPGYANGRAVSMRLWAAKSSREFDLRFFHAGDYIGAVEDRVRSENISKVLYPSEEAEAGRELRLKQQYFFVAATLQDILRRHRKLHATFESLPDEVAIHLNETHPAIAVPELLRLLIDEEGLGWDEAWGICERTFAYTNHTILPEALETWPVELMGRVLPRHLQLIYEINRRFLDRVAERVGSDSELRRRVSLIEEGPVRRVRMAHLAIVGSTSVNGVSALHTKILRERVFRDFHDLYPERFNNKTNGVTPRRWLLQCNPPLSALIGERIGWGWVRDLEELQRLEPLAEDPEFRSRWRRARQENKVRLVAYLERRVGAQVDPASLFDVQVKRIHEYKRQVLNVLHVIALYHRICDDPGADVVPRTVLFGGKAAPAYFLAKRTIALIHAVAEVVNRDPRVAGRLKVLFLPNYCVSQAEKLVPAADLSEQISTAGLEASGTGNMKFALNGALTIGTLDGANIEIEEAVGSGNLFIFGHTAEELAALRGRGYDPRAYRDQEPELARALDDIARGAFSGGDRSTFWPVVDSLLHRGDPFFVLADFRPYLTCQEAVSRLFRDPEEWTRRSILNTARMGRFSSDRAIAEYVKEIWKV
ncbi:MAG: glycogen/starch/alpha-glucan phosphorylase [Deltaproteobacteria bacterium]|nr:glycogen/starch/alpha-glucan phosphorylase [Deltaproteobacteria bacterium]